MKNKNLNKAKKSKNTKLVPTFEDFIFEAVNKKAIEKENDKLYKKLVGSSGKSDTVEGEMLRAINKIIYRYYNDGDYYFSGYGAETAGPAATYFYKSNKIDSALKSKIIDLLDKSRSGRFGSTKQYEDSLYKILSIIIDHIKSKGKDLTKNTEDMYDFGSKWKDDGDGYY